MPSSIIDPHYIPAFSIEDVLLDKDSGAPLSGGLVTFYHDNQRGVMKPVFQITGTSGLYTFTQLPNPMVLSSIGTFEDALSNPTVPYFFPYDANLQPDLYYVVVTSSTGVEQFVRQSVPFVPASGGDIAVAGIVTNELSNPQFARVLFDTNVASVTYTVGTVTDFQIQIAPDWYVLVSSSSGGTITVSQLTPIGSLNIVTNPGTLLQISSLGLSKLWLTQQIPGISNLWGQGNLSATFVAKVYEDNAATLTLNYRQNDGTLASPPIPLVSAALPASGNYAAYPGGANIGLSGSVQNFPNTDIFIFFDIPLNRKVDITSVMVAPTGSSIIPSLIYEQESINRQADHLYHYYEAPIFFKPIPSYLVGWDFGLNPAQFFGDTVTAQAVGANKSYYAWDQTIIFQTANSGVTVTRNATFNAINLVAAVNGQLAMIQYLTGRVARDIFLRLSQGGEGVSVNISCLSNPAIPMRVSLWWTANSSIATMGTNDSLVTALDANGVPSVVTGWHEIVRNDVGQSNNFVNSAPGNLQSFDFPWFQDPAPQAGGAKHFAIVISTQPMLATNNIFFQSVSVVPGRIPTIPAPQTVDEVLQECQHYWESTYNSGVVPGTSGGAGTFPVMAHVQTAQAAGHSNTLYGETFGYRFNTVKRVVPLMTFYSPTAGTKDNIEFAVLNNGAYVAVGGGGTGPNPKAVPIATWAVFPSTKGLYAVCGSTTTLLIDTGATAGNPGDEGILVYHNVADSRIGIV